jgi:hypothetical protein
MSDHCHMMRQSLLLQQAIYRRLRSKTGITHWLSYSPSGAVSCLHSDSLVNEAIIGYHNLIAAW